MLICRRRPRRLVVCCLSLIAARALPACADTITVSPNQQYQTIAGWGSYVDETDQPTLQAWANAGFNIMRMSMPKEALIEPLDNSGNPDDTQPVSLSSNVNANLSKFNFADPSVSGFGSAAQYLSSHVSKFTLIADSWSPPQWMKGPVLDPSTGQPTTSQFIGNPSWNSPSFPTPWLSNTYNAWVGAPYFAGNYGNTIGGRLKTEDPTTLATFGNYMASWVNGFQKQYGVPISNISIQNESTYQNPFESMVLNTDQYGNTDFSQYADALQSVVSAFQANGITTQIRGPHVAGVGGTGPSDPYLTWAQVGMINAVKNAPVVNNDPLINSLSDYTSNYYVGTDDTSARMLAEYWNGSNNVPAGAGATWAPWGGDTTGLAGDGKQNWFVETTDGGPGWLSNSDGSSPAIDVALKINNALIYANASAYLYWQFSDGSATPDSSSLLGTTQLNNPTQSQKLDAVMQYSKFIKPGAVRIAANFSSSGTTESGGADAYDAADASNVSAFVNPDGSYVFVLINMTATGTPITLTLPSNLAGASFGAYRTSASEDFANLGNMPVANSALSFTLPADSVETVYSVIPEPASALLGLLLIGINGLGRPRRRGPAAAARGFS